MNERYPIVTDIKPSSVTAGVLKNLLYCQDGILTAHLSYMYQAWLNAPQNKVLRDFLVKLAKNNGDILDALGNIAVAFGGDPNFMTTNGKKWSTQYLLTSKNKAAFLNSAIRMEQNAIKDLEKAIIQVENQSLKKLLTSIMEDKQKIVQDLKNLS